MGRHTLVRAMECKTPQVFPARPGFRTLEYTIAGSENLAESAHPLYRISSTKRVDFPLLTVKYLNQRQRQLTYEPLSLRKIRGRPATHLPRVLVNIHECLAEEILDFVDPWFQFVSEDGKRVTRQVRGHDQDKRSNVEGTRRSRCYHIPYQHAPATLWPRGYVV